MRGSEALLRAIANTGGEISAIQIETWMSQLLESNLLAANSREDENVFYYELTEKAKNFLIKKGVSIGQ